MNKNIIYVISALIIGLLLGYFIFNDKSTARENEHNHAEVAEVETIWTCSMHPHIMQPEPGDCPICGMELIPAEDDADHISANEIRMTPNSMALANIQTSIVNEATMDEDKGILLSGKITTNEKANTVQASYFEGRIEKLYVNYTGERVRKGQLLATIYAPSLVNAQQELITTAALKDAQPELYKAVKNKLKLWKLSDSQINEIEESGKVKEFFPIYATVSGTVSEKLVNEGDYVSQGQPILRLNNLNSVWAIFDAYENQIADLKIGDPITVSTNAYPNKKFKSKISFIDPILDLNTRTVAIRATIKNSENVLKPGMFAKGEIINKNKNLNTSGIQVPASAVMWTGERSLVYVKTNLNEPIFKMREVEIGKRLNDFYEIKEGLEKGEEIVIHGTFTVDAAAQLQGKNSMMTQVKNDDGKLNKSHHKSVQVSEEFQNNIEGLFNNYINLKDALVKDNAKKSQLIAKSLTEDLKEIQTETFKDNTTQSQFDMIKKDLKSSVSAISKTSDIEKQRAYFINLSKSMTHVIHLFGTKEKVYNLRCPMADNNQGAYWLSKDQEILNPYFGQSMLSCGEVAEVIN